MICGLNIFRFYYVIFKTEIRFEPMPKSEPIKSVTRALTVAESPPSHNTATAYTSPLSS